MREKLLKQKNALRIKRKRRIRGKISGTSNKPRISVFKSNRHLYAQAIDDANSVTLCAIDGKKLGLSANKESAKKIGAAFAEVLKENKIETAVLDRNGYQYNGVIVAFADALRDNGIKL